LSKTMYVEFRGKGFWAYDVVAAVLLKHMIDAANQAKSQPDVEWLANVIAQWQVNAVISDFGLYLDDNWVDVQTLLIQDLVTQACTRLGERDYIFTEEIQSWNLLDDERIFTRGHDPIPTAPVIRLGNAIISILQNKLEDAPAGTWWFFGLGEKKETIDMVS
jgi:hypothetical protein